MRAAAATIKFGQMFKSRSNQKDRSLNTFIRLQQSFNKNRYEQEIVRGIAERGGGVARSPNKMEYLELLGAHSRDNKKFQKSNCQN